MRCIALTFVLSVAATVATQEAPPVVVDIKPVSGPVQMMTATAGVGSGNLVFSAGPDGVLLVDTFTVRWASSIRGALNRVTEKPVKFIVNTHFHGDHVGGNELFGRDATILARSGVRSRMMVEIHPPWSDHPTPPRPPHAWPVITFDEPASLHFNGEEIRLIPFPRSHTDSDTVVFFTGSKVLAIGDLMYVVDGQLGPVSDDWSGGDMQSLARNLALLIPLLPADVKIIPGHGRQFTLAELKAYRRIIDGTLKAVRQGLAGGATLEQIIAQGLPAELDGLGDWTLSSQSWLEVAYQSLTRKE